MLEPPPFFAGAVAGEFGQFTSVDANRHIAELRRVVCDHFRTPALIQLLPRQLRRWHVRKNPQRAVLSRVHPRVTVRMVAHVLLHEFQFISHLLATMLLKLRFRRYLRVFDERQTWSFDFVFLVLNDISQICLPAHFLLVVLDSLLDRREARLIVLAELTVNVGAFNRLIFLPFLFES